MPARNRSKRYKISNKVNTAFRHMARIHDEELVNSLRARFKAGEDVRAEVEAFWPHVQWTDQHEHRRARTLRGLLGQWHGFINSEVVE